MSLAPEYIEAIQQLPKQNQIRALALGHHLKRYMQAEKQFQESVQKLSTQHLKQTLPLQQSINQLVNGERLPTQEELVNDLLTEEEMKNIPTTPHPIKNYWMKVLSNCKETGCLFGDEDEEALAALKSVQATLGENDKDFKISFEFAENPFFENTILEKEYLFHDEQELPHKCRSTQIQWKAGKNLTKKIEKKKQRNKKTNQVRMLENEVEVPSFFQYFKDIAPAKTNDEDAMVQEQIGEDLAIGELIMEEVIPNSLTYFLGVNSEDDDADELDEEDDEDDEDDEE